MSKESIADRLSAEEQEQLRRHNVTAEQIFAAYRAAGSPDTPERAVHAVKTGLTDYALRRSTIVEVIAAGLDTTVEALGWLPKPPPRRR